MFDSRLQQLSLHADFYFKHHHLVRMDLVYLSPSFSCWLSPLPRLCAYLILHRFDPKRDHLLTWQPDALFLSLFLSVVLSFYLTVLFVPPFRLVSLYLSFFFDLSLLKSPLSVSSFFLSLLFTTTTVTPCRQLLSHRQICTTHAQLTLSTKCVCVFVEREKSYMGLTLLLWVIETLS